MSSQTKLLLVVFAFALCGCGFDGTPVHFVVPRGFKGEIRLILDSSHGTEIKPSHGRYEYRIPQSGNLRVTSFRPFVPMHVETAAYEDGAVLPLEHDTWVGPMGEKPAFGKDAVVLSGGGSSQKNNELEVTTYFVGSTIEYEAWQDAQNPLPAPAKSP